MSQYSGDGAPGGVREGHRDRVCDRAPSLRAAPEARGGLRRGLPRGRGRVCWGDRDGNHP